MLTTNELIKDIGTVKFGKVHTFEYTITNTLGKDMVINKIRTSCSSCTKATLPNKIRGNESAQLKVTYTPGVLGNCSKWVDIIYDTDQTLRVNFKGFVSE